MSPSDRATGDDFELLADEIDVPIVAERRRVDLATHRPLELVEAALGALGFPAGDLGGEQLAGLWRQAVHIDGRGHALG